MRTRVVGPVGQRAGPARAAAQSVPRGVLRPPTLESQGFALPRARAVIVVFSVERLAGDPTHSAGAVLPVVVALQLLTYVAVPAVYVSAAVQHQDRCGVAPFTSFCNAARSGV